MTRSQRIVLLVALTLLAGCEAVAATAPQSHDTVDNPGQTGMKDSL